MYLPTVEPNGSDVCDDNVIENVGVFWKYEESSINRIRGEYIYLGGRTISEIVKPSACGHNLYASYGLAFRLYIRTEL